MTDLHCHILPCVDDGAENTEEALQLLRMEAEQKVKNICLTPHMRKGMFTTPDEVIKETFERLKKSAAEENIPVNLFLSREYYFNSEFLDLLSARKIIPMGAHNTVLVEFSSSVSYEELTEAAAAVIGKAYTPMFAHVERYRAVQKSPEQLKRLIEMGVFIQMNADSIIGADGWRTQFLCNYIISNKLVDVIASDAHDPEHRTVNLQKCRYYLSKKYGYQLSRKLMSENPSSILF